MQIKKQQNEGAIHEGTPKGWAKDEAKIK